MKLNIPGLLGAIGELPSVINKGLLGPLTTNPNLGLDPTQVDQARQVALQDMAYGMMAAPRSNPMAGLAFARGNARENFSGRMVDLLREQEIERMKKERDKKDANEAAYVAGLDPAVQPLVNVAGPQFAAQEEVRAQFTPGADGRTDDIKEYQLAVQQGFQGTLQDWIIAQKKASGTNVNVTTNLPPNESKFLGALGENAGKQLDTLQTQADSASRMLSVNARLKPLVNNPDFISGVLGDPRLTVAKVLGLKGADDTQVFFASMGEQVAERIKAFGAGTGLSDKDREFAEKIAGGSIELTPKAIKDIIDMNDKSASRVIDLYSERRKFYGTKHKEVYDYYPEIKSTSQGVDALLDKYAPNK